MKILFLACIGGILNAMDPASQRWAFYANRALCGRAMILASKKNSHKNDSILSSRTYESNYSHPLPVYDNPHSLIVAEQQEMAPTPKDIEQQIQENYAYLNYHTGVHFHRLHDEQKALRYIKRAIKGGFFDQYLPPDKPFSKDTAQESFLFLHNKSRDQNAALVPYLEKMIARSQEDIAQRCLAWASAKVRQALQMPLQDAIKDFEESLSTNKEKSYVSYIKFYEQLSLTGEREKRLKELIEKAWDLQFPTVIKEYYNRLKTPEDFPLDNGYIMLPDWKRLRQVEQDDSNASSPVLKNNSNAFERGLELFYEGAFNEAIPYFKKGLASNRLSFFYLGLLASHGYYGNGQAAPVDYRYAEKCFKLLIEKGDNAIHRDFGYKGLRHLTAQGNFHLGYFLVSLLAPQEPEKALSLLEWLEQRNNEQPVLYSMPAPSTPEQKNYIQCLKEMVKTSDDAALVAKAKTLLIDCCNKRVNFLRKQGFSHSSNMLYWLKQYVKARHTHYAQEDPDNCFAIAQIYGLFKDKDKERQWLLKIKDVQPANANLHLGLSYGRYGESEKDGWIADTYFKKALYYGTGSTWYQAALGLIKLHHAFYKRQYPHYPKQYSESLAIMFAHVNEVLKKEASNEQEQDFKKDYINKIFTHLLVYRTKDEEYSSKMYHYAGKVAQKIPIIKFLEALSWYEKNRLKKSYTIMRTIEGLDSITLPLLIEMIWIHGRADHLQGLEYLEKLLERIHEGKREDIAEGLIKVPEKQLQALVMTKRPGKSDLEKVRRAQIAVCWINYLRSKIQGPKPQPWFPLPYNDIFKNSSDYKAQILYALYTMERGLDYYKEGKKNQAEEAFNLVVQAGKKLIELSRQGMIPKTHPLLQEFYNTLNNSRVDMILNNAGIASLFNDAGKQS